MATSLADALAANQRPKTRPERVRDEILPGLGDEDRATLLAALQSNVSPGRIVDALKSIGVACSESAVRHYRKNHAAR